MTLLKSMWKSVMLMSIAGVLVFAGGAFAQTVTLGAQSAALTAGTAGSATFSVTLEEFAADPGDASPNAAPTIAGTGLSPLPTGVSFSLSAITSSVNATDGTKFDGAATLTVTLLSTATALTVTDLKLTVGGTQSGAATLTIGPATPVVTPTVTLGTQSAALTAGTAGSATFAVTLTGFAADPTAAANSSPTIAGTGLTPSLPTGVSFALSAITATANATDATKFDGSATLTVTVATAAAAITVSDLKLTVGGTQSAAQTLTITDPNAPTVTLGNQTGTLTAGTAGSATFAVTLARFVTDPTAAANSSPTITGTGLTPSLPTGVTFALSAITATANATDATKFDGAATLTVTVTTAAAALTVSDLKLTIATIVSGPKTLTIGTTAPITIPGSIAGKISGSDQGSGTLPAAATVTLLKDGAPLTSSITANPLQGSNGSYTLANVPAGIYTVTASMSGYIADTTGNITVGTIAVTDRNLVLAKAYGVTFAVTGEYKSEDHHTAPKITANESNGKPIPYGTSGEGGAVKENTTVTFEVDTLGMSWQVTQWDLSTDGGSNWKPVQKGISPRYTVVVGKLPIKVRAVTIAKPAISATLVGLDTSKFQVNRPVSWVIRYELKNGLVWNEENNGDATDKLDTSATSKLRLAAGMIPPTLTQVITRISNTVVTDTIKGTISDLVSTGHTFGLTEIPTATIAKYVKKSDPPVGTVDVPAANTTPAQVAGFPANALDVKAKTVIAQSNIAIDNAAATYQIGQYRKVSPSLSTSLATALSSDGGTASFHVTYRDAGNTIVSQALLPEDSARTANYGVLNAGTYTVSVRAFNRYYEGTKATTFVVNPRDISITSNNITPTATTAGALTYDGTDQSKNISVKVQDGQTMLVEGVDWEGRYTGAAAINPGITKAGVDTVKVKGIGNYTGIRNTTYSVNKLRIYVDTSAMSAYARPYNGTTTFDTIPSTGTPTAYQLAPAVLFSEAANATVGIKGTTMTGADPSGTKALTHRTDYVVTAGNFVNASGTATADSATATRVKLTVKLLDSLNYTLNGTATATSGGSVDFFKKATINRAVPDTSHFKFSIPETLVHGYTGKARGIGDVTLKTTLNGMGKFRVLYGADTAKPVNVGSYPVTVVVDSLGANFRTGTVALGTYTISAPGVPVIDDIAWQTGITVREGVALALTVPATAPTTGGTLSYQWFRDDVAVANNGRAATLNVNGLINGNTYNFKVIVTNTKSAGAAGSEVGTVERVVAVTVIDPPINLSTATFSVKGAYVYTGSPIEPPSDSIIVTVPAKEIGGDPVTLTRGVDYTVSFARNTNVGNATVSITGVDEYIGLRTSTFQIRAKTPDANDLTFRGRTVYNGKTQAITVSPIAGTGLGAVTVKYDGSTTAPKDAGMYVVTADFAAGTNFTAATNVSLGFYTISPLTLTADSLIFKRWPNQILVDSVSKYAVGNVYVRVDSTKLTVLYAGDEEVPTTIGSYPVTVLVEDENFVTGLIPLGEFNVVDTVVSVKSGNRVVPGTGTKEVAAVAPVKAAAAVFTAGPSPVSKNGTIKFFSAKQVTSGSLYIFDATGKSVAKVGVKAGTGVIGSWSVGNAAEGSYIVKGVLAGKDGTREKVSFVFSVVK